MKTERISTKSNFVVFENFELLPPHLERLLEIRKARQEIDPSMRIPAIGGRRPSEFAKRLKALTNR